MIVRVPPMERSIPTPIHFQVERVASIGFKFDSSGMAGDAVAAQIADMRGRQFRELDALEDEVRRAYDMPPRKHGYDKATAPAPAPSGPPAPPPPPTPPATSNPDLVARIVGMRAIDRACQSKGHRVPVLLSIKVATASAERFGGRLLCENCQQAEAR